MEVKHTWRTHPDPFEQDWVLCEGILEDAPELEAKFLFEWLCERYPDIYQEGSYGHFSVEFANGEH